MARKNPNLHIFKNRFNLDLEYWWSYNFTIFHTINTKKKIIFGAISLLIL
jgi:hypothetical protein